jgi:ferredoxin
VSTNATNLGLRVRFEPSGIEIDLALGERLLDAVDDCHQLGLLPTACRAGNCGACRVRVRAGADRLEPAHGEERAALADLGCMPDERLGCQVHARASVAPHDSRLVTLEILRG